MCRHCSAPLHNPALDSKRCFHCARDSHPWHRAVALGRYRGELSQAILRTKRPRNEPLTIALAELLFVQRKESLAELTCDCIIPMPMHWLRRWRRGINGPELLAEVLAGRLKLPVKRRWLRRIRITPLQTDLSVTNRLRQQRGSFRASRIAPIRGRRILLVDDVLTTGATAAEAARMLLARGAEQVSLAAIARGLGDDAS
jgi:ComF family protein